MNYFLRYLLIVISFISCFGCVALKLWKTAVVDASFYLKFAHFSRSLKTIKRAIRGSIIDRNGNILAITTNIIDLGVDPSVANFERDFTKIQELSRLLSLDIEYLQKCFKKEFFIKNGKRKQVRWKKIAEISNDTLYNDIKLLKIKGVYGNTHNERIYPNNTLACHVIGFINKENIAANGVESFCNEYLKGKDGTVISEKDGKKQEIAMFREVSIDPEDGLNVTLTIDISLQDRVEELLLEFINKYSAISGTVIVSYPNTGEILTLANYPNYDLNQYNKTLTENLKNRAITDIYEPGSVFKIVASSIALDEGIVLPNTKFDCSRGEMFYKNKKYILPKDHKPFDKLTVTDILRKSSNRGIAQIGILLGQTKLYHAAKLFGFGEKTEYGFDGESAGILNNPKQWDGLTITRLPMGHAIGVTPLQMHQAMGVIASGGLLMRPMVVSKVTNKYNDIVYEAIPYIKRKIIRTTIAKQMAVILNNKDTASAKVGKFNVSYKTGTTQKLINGKYSTTHHISSCSGFFPTENPQFLITVVLDDAKVPNGVAYGSKVAHPLFESIVRAISSLYRVKNSESKSNR